MLVNIILVNDNIDNRITQFLYLLFNNQLIMVIKYGNKCELLFSVFICNSSAPFAHPMRPFFPILKNLSFHFRHTLNLRLYEEIMKSENWIQSMNNYRVVLSDRKQYSHCLQNYL